MNENFDKLNDRETLHSKIVRDAEQVFEIEYIDEAFNEAKSVSTKKLSELTTYSSLCKEE